MRKLPCVAPLFEQLKRSGYRIDNMTLSRRLATYEAGNDVIQKDMGRPPVVTNEQEKQVVDTVSVGVNQYASD